MHYALQGMTVVVGRVRAVKLRILRPYFLTDEDVCFRMVVMNGVTIRTEAVLLDLFFFKIDSIGLVLTIFEI